MTLLSFLLGFATDAVWTLWSRSANAGRAQFAASMSVLIFLCGIPWQRAVVILDVPVIVAYLAGAYLGTWVVVRCANDKKPTSQNDQNEGACDVG